ncbi:MAG: pilus assembly protein PilM [Planctomycetes bacterium]|nr:pilus assembly protein PilM [Planctomycetota bacterium]
MASLVQLSGSANSFDLQTAVQCRLPEAEGDPEAADRAVAEALRGMVNDHRLRGRSVVACLSTDELVVETVRLPQLPIDEITKAAQWEAAERLSIPIDQAEVRHLLAGEVRQDSSVKQEVILVACPRDLIRRRLKILESAGLLPVGLDIEPCAFLRSLFRAQGSPENTRTAYLNCSESGTTVMFAEGRRILFLKSIAMGGRQFDDAVSQNLGVDQTIAHQMRTDVFSANMLDGENEIHRSIIESLRPCFEAIIEEMELCIRYHKVTFRGKPLDGLIMSGSEAAPWLSEYFCDRVGLSCKRVTPLDGVTIHSPVGSIQNRSGRWAAPLGLAMKRLPQ